MADLSELYQQVILDHNRKPRNFRVIDNADRRQEGFNPLCGDQLVLYLDMDGDTIKDRGISGIGLRDFKSCRLDDDSGYQGKDSRGSQYPV